MRTKTLLLAAAAAVAGIASLQAQSNVYSVNVVGYVNVTIPSGYSLIANPLNSSDNTVSNLFNATTASGAALGSTVYTWNGAGFIGNNNDEFGGGWASPAQALPPGAGFFIKNPNAAYTNTFVGEVLTGNLTNTPVAGYSLIASKVPQAGFVADLGLSAGLGDTIYMWNGAGFIGINNDEFGGGWSPTPPFTVDNVKGPQIGVAQSFFYKNIAGTATWERNFTIP
jgi:hypothetical protein